MYASGLHDCRSTGLRQALFPGMAIPDSDSHVTLPVVSQNENFLDSVNIYPFHFLTEKGIASVMTAHLQLPALEPNRKNSIISFQRSNSEKN